MKKFSVLVVAILAVFMLSGVASADRMFVSMGTGGVSGVYYPLGGGMASVMNMHMDGVNCSVESTGGSVSNINLMKKGESQLGMSASSIFYDAVHGKGAFKNEPVENVLGILSLYPEAVQIVTLADSGINSIADMKGKKIAVGAFGSGTELMAKALLAIEGITYDDINEDYLGFGEASTGLKDRTIAAGFIWAGVPTSGIMDLASLNKISLVSIEKQKIVELKETMPFISSVTIPAGTYKGMKKDCTTLAIPAVLGGRADLSEEFVYNMLKTLFENHDQLVQSHTRGKDVTLETALDGLDDVPLHPGAVKYYKEKGILN